MESYPEELLVGVFPLVFCVDATLQKSLALLVAATSAHDDGTEAAEETTSASIRRVSSGSSRSQFDKFLDAVAASLLDGPDGPLVDPLSQSGEGSRGLDTPKRTRSIDSGWSTSTLTSSSDQNQHQHHHGGSSNSNNPMMALFRGDDYEEDSDVEDELIFGQGYTPKGPGDGKGVFSSSYGVSSGDGRSRRETSDRNGDNKTNRSSMPKISFPRLGPQNNKQGNDQPHRQGGNAQAGDGAVGGGLFVDTSFANVLQQGQEFFQRARIVSISARHGFPPSKDPSGEKNRIRDYLSSSGGGGLSGHQGKLTLQTSKLLTATKRRPIDGILPSGWLEKHAAALPSVILVIVQIHHDQDSQQRQDELLQETLQNLQYSLAPKRQVMVHVVALVQDGVSPILADQWSQGMVGKLQQDSEEYSRRQRQLQPQTEITLLPVSDLQQDSSAGYSSPTIRDLICKVRDASLQYYWNQGKDVKEKLIVLGPARRTPLLLPLSIRYCFKLAVFYEFQWKHEKSIKYMIEAYRLVETYFRYLLQQREVALDADEDVDNKANKGGNRGDVDDSGGDLPGVAATASSHMNDSSGGGEGVELSLSIPPAPSGNSRVGADDPLFYSGLPEGDMVFQCRAVADWLNFKILQSGLVSNSESGLLAASSQWQRHIQAFCCPRRSFIRAPEAPWLDWSFVSQQNLVFGQLLERYPSRAVGKLGSSDFDEDLLRCSPWRTFEAAAEAFIKTDYQIQVATRSQLSNVTPQQFKDSVGSIRTRYVGGIDNEGFNPMLQEESKVDHEQKALDCCLKSISLFEKETELMGKAENPLFPWIRSAARLHYVVAGILLRLGRHEACIDHLEKASTLCEGWSGLQSAIHRMLVCCFEQDFPWTGIKSDSLVPVIMDSCFNSRMSNNDLKGMLEKLLSLTGDQKIQWHRDFIDEADPTLPFSFAVTFPTTHAIAGEVVVANVWIKSNLDYPVHISSVTLLSLAGLLHIPSNDLVTAKNANEGTNGGIIIQSLSEVELTSRIDLPKDLNQIMIDEDGIPKENRGIASKDPFTKNPRPRTGGITAGAGARFVSEDDFGGTRSFNSSKSSSLCLGGKPLRSEGLRLVFYPIYSTSTRDVRNTEIELTIKKKQPKIEPNIKRTLSEDENYVSSAWRRPKELPLSRGPLCLRVLPPMPNLSITNVTESYTNGRTLEGTVNRFVLQLKAGPSEICSEIALRTTCSSCLITPNGTRKRIVLEGNEIPGEDDVEDMMNPRVRTPILVKPNATAKVGMVDYGYELPRGWTLVGDGQGSHDEYTEVAKTLKCGEIIYVYFDVYRPTPEITRVEGVVDSTESEDVALGKHMCETEVGVSIRYRQEIQVESKKSPTRGRNKKTTTQDMESNEMGDDFVFMDYSVSLLWSAPLSAIFALGSKQAFPSGNRHPSNSLPEPGSTYVPPSSEEKEIVLIDKEKVTTRCAIEAVASADGLNIEIEQVRFADSQDENALCHFHLLSGSRKEGILYKGELDDPGRKLSVGSQFTTVWTTEVAMKDSYLKGSVTASLGIVSVYWKPSTLELPSDIKIGGEDSVGTHGPLRMDECSICRFKGPQCYIENAPFEAVDQKILYPVSVAVPFVMTYYITNKTAVDQEIEIKVKNSDSAADESGAFLIGGITSNCTSLGPLESRTFSFTAVPTKVGRVLLPMITVSSKRYRTWIIDESTGTRSIFVVP